MNYRDERDALRERVKGLEEDLGEAHQKLAEQKVDEDKRARIAAIERRMRETEQNLHQMQAELHALRGGAAPRQASKSTLIFVTASVALLGVVAGMVTVFWQTPARPPVVVQVPEPPPPVVQPPEVATGEVPQAPAEEVKPQAPRRQATVRFSGRVTRAVGLPFAPGSPCEIVATLGGDGKTGSVEDLGVTCAGRSVYRSTDKLEGMSMNSAGFAELAGIGKDAGSLVYALKYTDTGSRAGPRTQVSIDTTHGVGAAWSDVMPSFRVDFKVPETSAPVKGERLTEEKSKTDDKPQ